MTFLATLLATLATQCAPTHAALEVTIRGTCFVGTDHAERLIGSAAPDTIFAFGGNDVVLVRRGGRDHVSCGRGRDRVYADRRDVVARDCERVYRR